MPLRVERFNRALQLNAGALTGPALNARLAAFAKAKLAEAQAANQAGEPSRRTVNGQLGALEESVIAPGPIVYYFDGLADALALALELLQRRALPGIYARGFFVVVDGRKFNAFSVDPVQITADAKEVLIGNWLPWSRKAEVQLVGKKALKFSVAPFAMKDVAAQVNRRFGNVARVQKLYTLKGQSEYRLKTGKKAGKMVESPGIKITRRG